jgi:hypothetical protein
MKYIALATKLKNHFPTTNIPSVGEQKCYIRLSWHSHWHYAAVQSTVFKRPTLIKLQRRFFVRLTMFAHKAL